MGTLLMKDVGRDKRTWSVPLTANPLDIEAIEDAVVRAVNKKRALMSREIDAQMDSPDGGSIFAGFRTVGRFEIIEGGAP